MRLLSLVVVSAVVVACGRSVDVRGLYTHRDGSGTFIPCDGPTTLFSIADSALAARYRLTATRPYELLFVRLRGLRVDSGSIYGGRQYLRVRELLELRARGTGECLNAAKSLASVLR